MASHTIWEREVVSYKALSVVSSTLSLFGTKNMHLTDTLYIIHWMEQAYDLEGLNVWADL